METKVITTREFISNQKKYFDLAAKQKVAIKRGNKFINLVVDSKLNDSTENWFNDFFAIPEQYRCNPFDISPSGDLFFADKRNVENYKLKNAIAYQQIKDGKTEKLDLKELFEDASDEKL